MPETPQWRDISLLLFGLRVRSPDPGYYDLLRDFLLCHPSLKQLASVVQSLPEVLSDLLSGHHDNCFVHNATRDTNTLVDWISGHPTDISQATSGIVVLPLLFLTQITQYCRLLQEYGVDHATLIPHVRGIGGIQGYCAGLPCAMAVASSAIQVDFVHNIAAALRLAFVLGVYGDMGDDVQSVPPMMVVRLKQPGQANELVKQFPGTVVTAITDPRSVTFSGSTDAVSALARYAKAEGMPIQHWPLRGKWHHPDNLGSACTLNKWCEGREDFRFIGDSAPSISVRSNRTGNVIGRKDFVSDSIFAILSSKCDWYSVLKNAADDMQHTCRVSHVIVNFGIGDCAPASVFKDQSLSISKLDAYELFRELLRGEFSSTRQQLPQFPEDAVAIVGASCRLPGASNLDELWSLLSQGRDQHQEIDSSRFDWYGSYRAAQSENFLKGRKFYANLLEDIRSFDHAFFSSNPREAASMDPQQRLILELAYEAMESSGYLRTHRRENGDRVACFVGASPVDYHDNTNCHAPTAYTATGTIRSFLTGRISHHFGWTGPSEVIDTACSSSLAAIVRACQTLQSGDCTMAVAGGVHVITSPHNFFDLGRAGFLSPTGQCKPFDQSADGYCRSDGAGLLVLKLYRQALVDSDQILGVIPGASTNQGGLSSSITVPHVQAQTSLYRTVLTKAGMSPGDVSYVEAHGTGTQVGDPIEMESIRNVFGVPERSEMLQVGSIKGNIGHCETAAGVAGVLKIITMLMQRRIPPQANFTRLNSKIPSLHSSKMAISTTLLPWESSCPAALVNGYGAAGSNSALLICAPPNRREQDFDTLARSVPQPIMLSAATRSSLDAYAGALTSFLSQTRERPCLENLAHTINSRRKRHKIRAIFNVANVDDLMRDLDEKRYDYEEVTATKRGVVLALSGQGKNHVGLSERLYDQYPRFRALIDECNAILIDLGHSTIIPAIFQTEPIPDPVVLQCALVVSQIAFARCWLEVGLKVDTVIGHSLGELAALAVSGVLSLHDCLKLVAGRARLMVTRWGPEKGAMLIVEKPQREVASMIQDIRVSTSGRLKLEIACYNSASSQVVVGSCASIKEMERRCDAVRQSRKPVTRRLDTDFGFHSALTTPILEDLDILANSLDWHPPAISLEVCRETDSQSVLPYSPSSHARQPVFFSDTVQRIERRLGPCLWIEAGMNTSIIPMLERVLGKDTEHTFFAAVAKGDTQAGTFISDLVVKMWRSGVEVDSWISLRRKPAQIWLPPYQFDKASHWLDNVDRAAEIQSTQARVADATQTALPPPPQMVVLKNQPKDGMFPAEFAINTSCERFSTILKGHRVCQRSMAPATLYLECVAMALSLVNYSIQHGDLRFEGVTYHTPVSPTIKNLVLDVRPSKGASALEFTIKSPARIENRGSDLVHVTGRIISGYDAQYSMLQRLFAGEKHRSDDIADCETLFSGRAYQLFHQIVNYETFFRGIQRISLSAREATADVRLPPSQPGAENTQGRPMCDAVTLDMFLQVLGLLVNSSELAAEGHILVGAGLESVSFSRHCQLDQDQPWKVYTKFTPSGTSKAVGDVMVYSADGDLVGMINGCTFSKVAISTLERLLGSSEAPTRASATHSGFHTRMSSVTNSDTSSGDLILTPAETVIVQETSSVDLNHLRQLVATYTGIDEADILDDMLLGDLGVDSLAAQGLSGDLEASFGIMLSATDLYNESLKTILTRVDPVGDQTSDSTAASITPSIHANSTEISNLPQAVKALSSYSGRVDNLGNPSTSPHPRRAQLPDLLSILHDSDAAFDVVAAKYGLTSYWTDVAPQQDQLLVSYIVEAFAKLDVDLEHFTCGQILPTVRYQPKHSKLMSRLWQILQDHHITDKKDGTMVRGAGAVPLQASETLHDMFVKQHPLYACEASLMALIGPRFADCLLGEVNPMDILFGSAEGWNALEEFYHNTPLLSTITEQLVAFVVRAVQEVNPQRHDPVRILEVGAGTGGTTKRLAKALSSASLPVQYTFSDISHSLLNRAKKKLAAYEWMDFQIFDLEKSAPSILRGQFDIVIGTNCVHATSDRAATMARLGETMREGGFAVISETTRIIDWCDLVFGLLDGWWVGEHGSAYPFQPVDVWMKYFRNAGFRFCEYSQGESEEANTQRLLLACKDEVIPTRQSLPAAVSAPLYECKWNIQTMTYKTLNELDIDADLYLPAKIPKANMSIALMLHGGGCVYFSKRSVRHQQITYLLSQNVLPISLNYRLCPETNIVDGAITDVHDAYAWVHNTLPSILLEKYSLTIDPTKIAAIGYSAGGHLAMSLTWTTKESFLPPPRAILSLYAPVVFSDTSVRRLPPERDLPPRTTPWKQIFSSLPSHPVIAHDPVGSAKAWLHSNDPRAELIRSFFHENAELPIMLNDIPCGDRFIASGLSIEKILAPPSMEQVRAICPLARLETNGWETPTFIIHGDADEVAPFEDGVKLYQKLKEKGVKCNMLALKGVGHTYDTSVNIGSRQWKEQVEPGLDFLCQELK